MAAEIRLQPLDERGAKIIDELEQHTGVLPFRTTARDYSLMAAEVDTSGFDAMLDTIAPDWREHLSRTP
jgi:hypothetical protein